MCTISVCCVASVCDTPANRECDIFDYLFTNSSYNKYLRPVKNLTTRTDIKLSLSLIAIVNFNEVGETITVTGILFMSWRDELLTWDPAEFDNVSHIHVPQDLIWRPYVNLENSVIKLGDLGNPFLQVDLHHDGMIEWEPVEEFTISCHLDLYMFPFDTQKCSLVFEAYGMHEHDEKFLPGRPDLDLHEYTGTSGWVVTETKIETAEIHGTTHILCSLTLSRKHLYVVLNIFCPIILLSILNICVFLIPVDSGEKIGFAVTMFLSMIVFLTIVSSKLPENSDRISLLNIYVFVSTVLSTLIAIITIIEIRVYFKDPTKPVPMCLQKFVKFELPKLPKWCGKNSVQPEHTDRRHNNDRHNDNHEASTSQTDLPHLRLPDTQSRVSFMTKPSAMRLNIKGDPSGTSFITPRNDMHLVIKNYPSRGNFLKPLDDLQRGAQSVLSLNGNLTEDEEKEVKWPDVVKTLDWVFFFLFIAIYLLSSFFIWRFNKIGYLTEAFFG